jgi:hypothetical protein
MSEDPVAFIPAEARAECEELARRVAADLSGSGLPVLLAGDCQDGMGGEGAGVVIFYDPVVSVPSGVYVKWQLPSEFLYGAVSSGENSKMLAIAAGWLEVMIETLERMLKIAGWGVDAIDVGVHESSMRITGRH